MSLWGGGELAAVAPGMGGEAGRAICPILQVESLSHCYWASWPGAPSRPGQGLDVAVSSRHWEGGWPGQLLCESP